MESAKLGVGRPYMTQTVYEVRPDMLKHQDEIEAALRDQDLPRLKAIFEREGVEWIELPIPERYTSGIEN